jgi:hypothetical protein
MAKSILETLWDAFTKQEGTNLSEKMIKKRGNRVRLRLMVRLRDSI